MAPVTTKSLLRTASPGLAPTLSVAVAPLPSSLQEASPSLQPQGPEAVCSRTYRQTFPTAPIRPRVAKACVYCRKRKAKCDEDPQCNRCVESGRTCIREHRKPSVSFRRRVELQDQARVQKGASLLPTPAAPLCNVDTTHAYDPSPEGTSALRPSQQQQTLVMGAPPPSKLPVLPHEAFTAAQLAISGDALPIYPVCSWDGVFFPLQQELWKSDEDPSAHFLSAEHAVRAHVSQQAFPHPPSSDSVYRLADTARHAAAASYPHPHAIPSECFRYPTSFEKQNSPTGSTYSTPTDDGSASAASSPGSFPPRSPVMAYSSTRGYTPSTSILHGGSLVAEHTSPDLASPDAARGFPPSASGVLGYGDATFQVPYAAAPLGGEYWVVENYAYLPAQYAKAVPSSSSLDGAV